MLKKEYGKTRKSLATARLFRVHLFCTHDMAKNRNYDRNPSRGCNFDLEGGAFLILGGATTALGGALLYPWGQ